MSKKQDAVNPEEVDYVIEELFVPKEVLPLIIYAAKSQGWTEKVTNEAGEQVDNPITPFMVMLDVTIQMLQGNATQSYVQEKYEKMRSEGTKYMQELTEIWRTKLKERNATK